MRRVGSRGRVTVLTGYMRHPGFFWQIVVGRIYRIGKSSPHSPTHVIRLLWACQLAPRTDHRPNIVAQYKILTAQVYQKCVAAHGAGRSPLQCFERDTLVANHGGRDCAFAHDLPSLLERSAEVKQAQQANSLQCAIAARTDFGYGFARGQLCRGQWIETRQCAPTTWGSEPFITDPA